MAEIKQKVSTRLVMRNADLTAWEASTSNPLLKGEIALAKILSGENAGSYKMKIGVGDKTWNELSDQGHLIIPAKDVEGLNDAIAALSTSYYETGNIETLSGTYVNGDIAVEKKTIEGDLSSFTAFRYDTTDNKWKALDGNYNASNVYFDYDITKAGSWGATKSGVETRIGNVTHSSNTVETMTTKGKSVAEVMDMIFKGEEGLPDLASNNKPTCSVSTPQKEGYIGQYVTPTASFSWNARTYKYGSNTLTAYTSSTGVTLAKYSYKYTSKGVTTMTDIIDNGTTASITLTEADKHQIVVDGSETHAFSIYLSCNYNAAATGTYIPKTTLNRVLTSDADIATYRTATGQATNQSTGGTTIKGYFPYYEVIKGTKAFDIASMTADDIVKVVSGVATAQNGFSKNKDKPSSITDWKSVADMQQWIWVVKSGKVNSIAVTQKSPEAPHTVNKRTIELPLDNNYEFGGSATTTYDIFYIDNPSCTSGNSFKVTIS